MIDDEIVDYLVGKYVYAEADRWSNARIRAFTDRMDMEATDYRLSQR